MWLAVWMTYLVLQATPTYDGVIRESEEGRCGHTQFISSKNLQANIFSWKDSDLQSGREGRNGNGRREETGNQGSCTLVS